MSISVQVQSSMFSTNTAVQSNPSTDALLGAIAGEGQSERRPLIMCLQKMEFAAMGAGAAMKMMSGGPVDITINYDLIFGPAHPTESVESMAMMIPVSTETKSSTNWGFGASVDSKTAGLEQLNTAITTQLQAGWRLAVMLPGPSSGQSSGGMTGSSGAGGGILQLVFQKLPAGAPYAAFQLLAFPLTQKVTMGGIKVLGGFDPIPSLQAAGQQGWECVGIAAMPASAVQGTIGMGSEITTIYAATMIKKADTPIQYMSQTVNLIIKAGIGGTSVQGSIIPTIQTAAAAGWGLVGSVNLPAVQSGMTQKMPILLVFSNSFAGFTNAPVPS